MKTTDHRRLARTPPGKGLIYIDDTNNGFAVTVLAARNGTARLRQHFPFPVPESFTLATSSEGPSPYGHVRCEKLSQSGDLIRVRFNPPQSGFWP